MARVEKPWGWEETLVEGRYLFKRLFVLRGHRTSLQYHEQKHETLYIVDGMAVVRLDSGDRVMEPGEWVTIEPGTVHRVEGLVDTLYVEASTPEDETVRVEDDYGRA